jgi:hypothetical protein
MKRSVQIILRNSAPSPQLQPVAKIFRFVASILRSAEKIHPPTKPRITSPSETLWLWRATMQLHRNLKKLPGAIVSLALLGVGLMIGLSIGRVPTATAADGATRAVGPTVENAWAAEQAIAKDMQDNNAEGVERALADDWAVIAATGGVGEGNTIFPQGIKTGALTRKTFVLSEPRIRLYGSVALITTKVQTSGMFQGKPFDITERQTDVLLWAHGGWKSVLTHETKIGAL